MIKRLSDTARANRLAIILDFVIAIPLTLSYITQGTKNSIPLWGLILILASIWIPIISSFVLYKKAKEFGMIRYIVGIGYVVFYLLVCLISEQRLVFAYSFPMLIALTVYCDFKFSTIESICCTLIALVHAVVFTIQVGFTPSNTAAMEIEIAAAVLVGVYSVLSSKFIIAINQRKTLEAATSDEQTRKLLASVMEISNILATEVVEVSEKMNILSASSSETKETMLEVSQGSENSAAAVATQMFKTDEIQNQITNVASTSEAILSNVTDSASAIKEGHDNVLQLINNAKDSEDAGNEAVAQLTSLKEYTDQMGSILLMIEEITSQTNLLSLNASIEAARAGEAGRGFAVVAGEISSLATQTQNATANIHDLIENVTAKVDTVATAINDLIESNHLQATSANKTAGSFERISESNHSIHTNSSTLADIVTKLNSANKEIVENIHTISAITEEVTAHSTVTYEKTAQNEVIVTDVQGLVKQMTANAEKLKEL